MKQQSAPRPMLDAFRSAGTSSSAASLSAFSPVGLGGWASTAQISGALIAQGSVVVDSNVKKVQHPTGGVVGEVRAHDGDHVKAGDMLIRLDETVTRANLAIVTKGLTELYARKARLAAERDGADTVAVPKELADHLADPDVKEALASERKLFDLRRTSRVGQKDQLRQRIGQLREEIGGLDRATGRQDEGEGADRSGTRRRARIVAEESGLRRQADRARARGGAARGRARPARRRRRAGQGQDRRDRAASAAGRSGTSSDVAKELRETDSKIGEYVERKVTAEDQLKRTDIRAPQDGVVFQSTANTVGGVITAGDPIMLIVPEAELLLVEVKVEPKDIDQVQIRSTGRCSAFPRSTAHTPELNGKVVRVGADTSTDQRTGQSYYLVRISMTDDEIGRLGDVKLTPGMPVEAFIQTGERTVLSYLVKPLQDQLKRSFREK